MKRRILAVLTAALLAVGVGAAATPASAAESNASYVAIGDSIASGNGLMPYEDPACLRSKKAYPSLVAAALDLDLVSKACTSNNTTQVACAATWVVLFEVQAFDTTQVAAQATGLAMAGVLGPDTHLVTISAGVNDLPWITAIGACSNLGTLEQCAFLTGIVDQLALAATVGIAQTLAIVRAAAPTARIVVTGYPQLFGDFTGTCSVGVFDGAPMKIEAMQAQLLNGAVLDLNQAIQNGIALYQQQLGMPDPGVVYVDVVEAFDTHGLCDTGERWISGLIAGKPKDRGFHPNVAGQQAYANEIWEALAQ